MFPIQKYQKKKTFFSLSCPYLCKNEECLKESVQSFNSPTVFRLTSRIEQTFINSFTERKKILTTGTLLHQYIRYILSTLVVLFKKTFFCKIDGKISNT